MSVECLFSTTLLAGRPLSVHNIRVDPDSAGLVFIVHGTDSRSTDGKG